MLAHHSMVSWPGYVCTATNSVSTTGNQAPSQATNHKPAAGAASDAPSRHPHPTTQVQATAHTAPRILPLFAASRHDKHDYIHRALTKTSMFFFAISLSWPCCHSLLSSGCLYAQRQQPTTRSSRQDSRCVLVQQASCRITATSAMHTNTWTVCSTCVMQVRKAKLLDVGILLVGESGQTQHLVA